MSSRWLARRVLVLFASCLLLASLASATVAQDDDGIARRPVEDQLFGVASVVPEEWQDVGNGIYARGAPPDDVAFIAIQSVPASIEQIWPGLLPQLLLDEVPDESGELRAAGFDWTTYRIDVGADDFVATVELALTEDHGRTHLVMLQARPDELEVLRSEVFLPAIEAFRVLAPEPTPDLTTLGFAVEEVSFPGGSAGVELAGTLTLPRGPGLYPAIVLMSGSGAQDRDESLRPVSALKPFALIADALTAAGVAVLRYDDRGVGGSTGDYAAATIAELAADGEAALEYLRDRDDIDPDRIGILGHSEGGLYAAMLAADDPAIAFVVGMAPPAVDGVSLIVAQNEAMLRAAGEDDDEIEHAVAGAKVTLPLARDGDAEGLEETLRELNGGLWDRLSDEERTIVGEREVFVDRQVESVLPVFLSDWYRSILNYDPAPDWQRVSAPVLGLFGARDVQVVTDQNEPALRRALEAGSVSEFEIVVLPDANHLFQAAETGAVTEYASLLPAFTADFLPTLVAWVTEQVGLAG